MCSMCFSVIIVYLFSNQIGINSLCFCCPQSWWSHSGPVWQTLAKPAWTGAACLSILGLSCPSNFFFIIVFHDFPQSSFLITRDSFTTTALQFLFASHIVMFILSYCQCWLPILRPYRPSFAMTVPQLRVTRLFLGSRISQGHYGQGLGPQKLVQILV